jgi:uncharacterized protein involved in exopolysaccharide biosynthesis
VQVQGTRNLTFRPSSEVSLEAYETLALSRGVLEEATQQVDTSMSYEDLAGTVEQLIGPQRPDQVVPLLVAHSVQHTDPEKAAQLADAWASASLRIVQNSLFANLQPISETTHQALVPLQTRLETAQEAFRSFEAGDNTSALQATLSRLSQLIADARTGMLSRSQLSLEQSSESTDLVSSTLASPNVFSSEFNLSSSVNLEQEIAATEAVINSLRAQGQTETLVEEQAYLESLKERREVLELQLVDYEQEYASIQQALANLSKERRVLELELKNAEEAYQSIVALQPMISYVTNINPANARLLSQASVPVDEVAPRRLLNTALATVLAGLLTLLFVFLREAVRVPIERKA